jgi:hypothetical protein
VLVAPTTIIWTPLNSTTALTLSCLVMVLSPKSMPLSSTLVWYPSSSVYPGPALLRYWPSVSLFRLFTWWLATDWQHGGSHHGNRPDSVMGHRLCMLFPKYGGPWGKLYG